jgi:lysophospholipase L1-like esterase
MWQNRHYIIRGEWLQMKNLLLYGDSNTWGFDPATTLRYPYHLRWTTICAALLGDGYNCIPAGMNGRTTAFDDPVKGSRNGIKGLDYELQTHKPLDLFVVMLGTNDLKYTEAKGSAAGMEKLIELVLTANQRYNLSSPVFPERNISAVTAAAVQSSVYNASVSPAGAVFAATAAAGQSPVGNASFSPMHTYPAVTAPILLVAPILLKAHLGAFEDDIAESARISAFYQDIAKKHRLHFMDAAMYAEPSEIDGVHLSIEGHKKLGEAIASKIKSLL